MPGVYTNSDPKSSFLLDVEYHAQNSPSSLQYNINLSQVTPRAHTAIMIKPSKSHDRVRFRISEAPPPGHYMVDESFKKS